ncbi:MAG TPA: multicopper oxidase domain-containing protein [Candidatus Baltobacteraceae bacterium]
MRLLRACVFLAAAALACGFPIVAQADAEAPPIGVSTSSLGLQPILGPIPSATAAPGESPLIRRDDGSFQYVPQVRGHTKTFHIVERDAPWTLKPGLTVMAKTYNGVVPGPVIQVDQGDRVVIDYTNDQAVPDTIHLHGIHGIPVDMDGVPGISQPLVAQRGHYVYRFAADRDGTFIYHTHDDEAMLESGLYGAIVVLPAHPRAVERNVAHDYVELISSWMIQSGVENHFTINGKEYPATTAMETRRGQRMRIRWISMSGEEWHTMHTHGHYQQIIARDAAPVDYDDVEDTVALGPGQRVDVVVKADQAPGTWLVHCHVSDHIEDANSMPAGLVTAIHYAGTPETLGAMGAAMMAGMPPSTPKGLSFWMTALLGAIAGFTIFIGLPLARARKLSAQTMAALNAVAIGILVYLVIEIAGNATAPISNGLALWRGGHAGFPLALCTLLIVGLLIGLVGLGSLTSQFVKRSAKAADNPMVLATVIAIGIGAHNFGEGLAIGASAASGATAIAIGLIIGFGLHNATEGFGIAAPVAGRVMPSWPQIALFGLIGGGPTFVGTIVGYRFDSPLLSVLFLSIAAGALVYVIGELWAILKRTGLSPLMTSMVTLGFVVAFATEMYVGLNGG